MPGAKACLSCCLRWQAEEKEEMEKEKCPMRAPRRHRGASKRRRPSTRKPPDMMFLVAVPSGLVLTVFILLPAAAANVDFARV